ncbi:hypothetical protein CCOS865_02674 [Pseudomonas reidholzensis]|uniref:Uncharacterized protein n=1 Tax=Pseudomonas reidholzensis TaxID=1785162 RepID=A0A383RVI7_9PSED|nr:hypothetical protein [Pseudomonas reidholzensis]SYX90408.1 hypothetical protein CCOS865_02674 [Pseudomonas reidholzensis]
MALLKGSTRWVLFLGAKGEPEQRHVLDLAFGLMCLESAGVAQTDLSIYVDGQDRASILQWISLGSINTHSVLSSSDFFADCALNTHENIVVFVSGHGSHAGIDAPVTITPHALLQSIKQSPRLKNAVIYLGQCFAGIFNYMPVSRTRPGDVEAIFIGATNLYESLSSSTTERLVGGDASWCANLFLLGVFKWLMDAVDVDGDGRCTVMDSYKYAGVHSNAMNKKIKKSLFVRSFEMHEKWEAARQESIDKPSLAARVALKAIQKSYSSELDLRYVHQECWILNSLPAQRLEY